ncbi:MAG: Sodium:glutamate symporter, partial [Phycisphaerales bacterium]|nr:Sodium:glutamate symporter [Phycisphaerales bacterium]
VIAGLVGLLFLQTAGRVSPSLGAFASQITAEWKTWPGLLIAVVFSGLLLEAPGPGGFGAALRRGARSGVLAWIIILGQIAIGLIVYLIAVHSSRPGVPSIFGQLLEVSWAGGHGSAAAMGTLYAARGFPEGRDLAFFLATVGLVYGVLSGLLFVNIALRRGWTATPAWEIDADELPQTPAVSPVRGEMIEPLAVQVIVLAAAFGLGVLLQKMFFVLAGYVFAADDPNNNAQAIDAAKNVPLFLFTLLGGSLLRRGLTAIGMARVIDTEAIGRLVGVAMEFLIVAGVATMQLESLGKFGWPIVLLLVGAAIWSAVCLLVLSRRLLPPAYWFELGLLNYGFSTANTPQGMMLLRIVDPELKSGAAADYAVAAPLSAPFVGGGIVTFLAMPWLLDQIGATWVLIGLLAAIVGLYLVGRAIRTSIR